MGPRLLRDDVPRDARDTRMQPPYDAVVLDMDGVVTDTASLHAEAWKRLFDGVLADPRAGPAGAVEPFDPVVDYRRLVDGRRREDGVVAFLASRGVRLPDGTPDDHAGEWTVHGMAALKNRIFLDLLHTEGVRAFPGTVSLVQRLREGGTPLGLVTASRNAEALLSAAGLEGLFDVVVDGNVAARLGLAGKPDPATFLHAAHELGVAPARTAVVEDATSGVSAARRGGFGLIVAIDRAGQRRELEQAGADFVLDDVAELDLGVSRSDPWQLVYEGFDPAQESHREALTTLGNGYLGTRGCMPEHVDDGVHYPGTYLAGVYNRLTSVVDGRERVDEELVNAPNWLPFDVSLPGGGWWSQGALQERHERRVLDLRRGVLTRTVDLVDGAGRTLHVVQRRLVSMERPHLAALETALTPEGWSGRLSVRTGVDAEVVNGNAVESPLLADRHLTVPVVERDGNTLLVEVETTQSRVRVATATRTELSGVPGAEEALGRPDGPSGTRWELTVADGACLVVSKLAAVVTSRDAAVSSPRDGALAELARVDGFEEVERRHALAWSRIWEHHRVDVDTDDPVQLVVNLHAFHLLQTVSPHSARLDAGVPARGLHGEGYRGHVFWDQVFVLPLYALRMPASARALLDYRWRRLDAARQAAREAGYPGAMFPWQSGSDGRDETPRLLFNPRSGRWMPDNSWRQRHVGLAVAFSAWQYFRSTEDTRWFAERGAELVLEVARFFAGLATHDERDDRFHIGGVMGPDEFHDGYPDAPGEGLRDNAYTNVLTAWVLQRAVETLSLLSRHERDELCERLGVGPDDVRRWSTLARRLAVPFHDGVISQFDGYGDLRELDWDRYRRAYGNIERLDLILEAEGDTPNRYRVSKQADVLMLLYLLGPDDLRHLLAGLGYRVSTDDLVRTAEYYLRRSSHGSTLSRVVHTSVLAMLDLTTAWSEFREALDADLDDTQGGTTGHGVHLGAMAGTLDILLRTFTGMRVSAGALVFRPRAPGALRGLRFQVRYQDQHIDVDLDQHRIRLTTDGGAGQPVRVVVDDVSAVLGGGQSVELPLGRRGNRGRSGAAAGAPKPS